MALCALGLVSGDATLAGAALGELLKRNKGKKIECGLGWRNGQLEGYIVKQGNASSNRVKEAR